MEDRDLKITKTMTDASTGNTSVIWYSIQSMEGEFTSNPKAKGQKLFMRTHKEA